MNDARTAARSLAVQAIYQSAIAEENLTDFLAGEKMNALKKTNNIPRINKKIFDNIISAFENNSLEIDQKIAANLAEGWTAERIGALLRAILRAALAERKGNAETPKALIISEYVSIAADFYDEAETGFVNGILNKVIA